MIIFNTYFSLFSIERLARHWMRAGEHRIDVGVMGYTASLLRVGGRSLIALHWFGAPYDEWRIELLFGVLHIGGEPQDGLYLELSF